MLGFDSSVRSTRGSIQGAETRMTCDELIAAGWKEWKPNPQLDGWDRGFQRRVRGPEGNILYSVQAYFWRHSKYGSHARDGWELEIVSNHGCDWFISEAPLSVKTWSGIEPWTPAQCEEWAAEVYRCMGCRPYEESE